jgi:hypothetical protein
MKRIYIAGPYSHKTAQERSMYVAAAREAMAQLLAAGWAVYCPHTMTEMMEHDDRLTYEDFMNNCLEWVGMCHAMHMLPGWICSDGSRRELDRARSLNLPVYVDLKAAIAAAKED